ncbi:RES family NAD+ phosphorylase [Vibrio ulleungensis]|uniref:RES family NAD+ phosphorylase n=1 Tax=Vibrio ulleungensis TaxID=2807619 RepID=A0ABS2HGF8_9VIBR|nr:RES family NAD+ phosphorylase [Vibrio ulleungensis]MBM7036124.1 RES family NAD+ phosphorylase [Vibrio ulleungensis]
MNLYRVTNSKFANNFSGRGASFDDGARWNSAGNPVIYFALDMGTALVEAANYHPTPRLVPRTHCKAIYTVPNLVPIHRLDTNDLPDDWQSVPYPASTQRIGDQFLQAKQALLLIVPSVAIGLSESSVAIANPLHPDINEIKLIECFSPVYSERMFSGL